MYLIDSSLGVSGRCSLLLFVLYLFLKCRGAAERAYAAALSKSAEVLATGTMGGTTGAQLEALAKGHGDAKGVFLQVDLELMVPKVSFMRKGVPMVLSTEEGSEGKKGGEEFCGRVSPARISSRNTRTSSSSTGAIVVAPLVSLLLHRPAGLFSFLPSTRHNSAPSPSPPPTFLGDEHCGLDGGVTAP